MSEKLILVDDPAGGVRRITLNRPEKRNALSNALRGELFEALHAADADEAVHVTIIRGAGKCFSAGYELGGANEGCLLYTSQGRNRPHSVSLLCSRNWRSAGTLSSDGAENWGSSSSRACLLYTSRCV